MNFDIKQPETAYYEQMVIINFFTRCWYFGDSGEIGHLFRLKTAGGSDSNRPPKSERSDAGF
jgi:hypothetical protein